MTLSIRSRRILILVLLQAVIGTGILGYWQWQRARALPERGSPLYQEYQRSFQVGVAAVEAGREDLARKNLDRAVDLIPREPAGWANLGLLHLRKNDLTQAAEALQKAHAQAPESGEIDALLGILSEKQGRLPDAVAHYRKAVERKPRDLPSLFALAEGISKEGGKDSDASYQRLMEQILAVQPNNLPVLLQRAGAAHRSKDKAAFQDTVDRLSKLAPGWADLSRKTLKELQKVRPDDPGEVVLALQALDNVLKAERDYARDSRAIRPRPGAVGTPITQFLRLEPTRATPAPPDRDLSFKVEPQPEAGAKVQRHVARLLWLADEKQRDALIQSATDGGIEVRPGDVFKPSVFLANASEVRRGGVDGPNLSFPGGAKAIAPTAAGVLGIDWDNDLRVDLLLAGAGGLRFWLHRPDGSFADVTSKTGLKDNEIGDDYYGAWAADIEMDGDLDIIVSRRDGAPHLLRNNRDNTFKPVEVFPGVRGARAFVYADLDNDGASDAALLDAAGKLHLFSNARSGQFNIWLVQNPGVLVALTAADVNGDGVLDLVALRADGALIRLSDQDMLWTELVRLPGALNIQPGEASLYAEDLDNNGALDLIVATPSETHLFLADDALQFARLPDAVALHVSAVVDLNGDGRLDLIGLTAEGQPARALNQGTKAYHWQVIRPLANPKAGDDRINSFAIGGEIEVRAGPLVQKQAIHGPVLHFGLGEQTAVDVVRIVWPNGVPQWEFEAPSDKMIAAAQRLSGSCPFLFTYDGEGMRFVGDFMWGTPLGMFVNGQNAGEFPQTTEWLKIRGEHLRPKVGYYDVRVHANLWEADYFDQLALIVVDHPPDTEIHVDERFFLTPTPPRLHVTGPVQPVARAWDHLGQDAIEEVRDIDGRCLDRAPRGRFQGVTQDHWVEADLGDDAPRDGPVLLIARGWLHPTNSSINVALGQGNHPKPSPLFLEVPDGKGGWKAIGPPLGFPAGKDKTMLIRLDGLEGKSVSRRVRLRTSMEIYWDFLGYAVELDPKLARLQRPETSAAELRFRGITEMSQKNASSPEVPHYDKVIHGSQAWRDLTGYYTRFGDVRELLAKVDDRYVIMNAGDEIALRFRVPDAPPKAWKRDFIWECDGWTRDGDLNTRFGNTVLPLPAHGLNTDARPPGRLEEDPVYQRFPRDWRNFHTRYVTGQEFARGLRR